MIQAAICGNAVVFALSFVTIIVNCLSGRKKKERASLCAANRRKRPPRLAIPLSLSLANEP